MNKVLFALFGLLTISAFAAEPVSILWTENVENAYPRWSNDDARILYQTNRSGTWQIHVMNRDGTGDQTITSDSSNNNFPDWSPDNTMIAFVSDRGGNEDVYVMKMDGSGLKNLTNHAARDIHPYWAPDGKRILFNSTRQKAEEDFDIFIVNADGSGLAPLTRSLDEETCARFSPDQSKMVYLNGGLNDDVMTLDRDGKNPVNLTGTPAAEGWPAWSPDGSKIIYACDEPGRFCLYVMNADGSNQARLTYPAPEFRDARAMFSPDGTTIVFNRQKGATIGIFTMPLD